MIRIKSRELRNMNRSFARFRIVYYFKNDYNGQRLPVFGFFINLQSFFQICYKHNNNSLYRKYMFDYSYSNKKRRSKYAGSLRT